MTGAVTVTGMDLWLLMIVMSLAVYRLTRLVVADTFPPVLWLRDRLVGGWRPLTLKEQETKRLPVMEEGQSAVMAGLGQVQLIDGELHRYVRRTRRSPFWLAELLSCPWCAGGWIAGVITAATDIAIGIPAPILMGFATWALGSLLASRDWT